MEKVKKSSSNYSNQESGITLIALVITIIVLLILAGISISLVAGENGILKKATSAVTKTKEAQLMEEVELVLADWQTDNLVKQTSYSGRSETTASGAVVTCIGDNILVVYGLEIYTATLNNGQVGELTKQDLGEDSQVYKAMHPIVPTGFEHTIGEWNTGFVIKETATNDEFVWIPVVSNESYVKKSGTMNSHISENQANDNGKDVIALLSGDDYGTNPLVISLEKERSTVNAVGGFYVSRYEMGIDNAERTTKQTEANWGTIKSQKGLEPVRNISQIKALEKANTWKSNEYVQSGLITGTQWDTMCNFIGWDIADGDCSSWGNYTNVASKNFNNGDIWHIYLDNVTYWQLGWTNKAFQKLSKLDSDDYRLCSTIFSTGTFESINGNGTSQKNIYDVAGNVFEWTTETIKRDENIRVLRGGNSEYNGKDKCATIRDGYRTFEENIKDSAMAYIGFRAVLYVK